MVWYREQFGENYIPELKKVLIGRIQTWFLDKKGPAVIGISGGKDSSVCAALLVEALGKHCVFGVMMPNGVQADLGDSLKVVNHLQIPYTLVNIQVAYDSIITQITNPLQTLPTEVNYCCKTNTPARLRMTTLYAIAAQLGGFVCCTDNASESYTGYSTKWGDSVGDFSILYDVLATDVMKLGEYLGLPKDLAYKVPSDGMCGQSDEDKMGFTYQELDDYINGIKEPSIAKISLIKALHENPNRLKKVIQWTAT
jgi:NAD+ synthase